MGPIAPTEDLLTHQPNHTKTVKKSHPISPSVSRLRPDSFELWLPRQHAERQWCFYEERGSTH